jgi:hypothetical protein
MIRLNTMRRGRSTAAGTPKKPVDAVAGAALVRKYAIKLFDRDEGEAANWPLIADTLFKAAFDDDRLPADPAAKTPAPAGRNEAAKTDLQSPGPGAADAFRGIS